MRPNPLSERIESIIGPTLTGMGYGLVLVRLTEAHKRRTLQVFIEWTDGRGIVVEDCTEVSHVVSALMDVQDPIEGAYNLEVSSPGIDRPLVKMADFARYIGQQARIELSLPVQNRKRFSGVLTGVEGEDVLLRTADGKNFILPFNQMASAKLVLTDELIKAHADAAKNGQNIGGIAIAAAVNDNLEEQN